jgi:hypothetical protein
MKNQRLKQFAACLLVVLSLFVSSVSACTCSSHKSQTNELSHCQPQQPVKTEEHQAHQHTPDLEEASHHDGDLPENILASFSDDECCCVQSTPRVSAKTENIKIEKQKVAVSSFTPIKLISELPTVPTKTVDFIAPYYLSDSFHNLTPGRAPPRL